MNYKNAPTLMEQNNDAFLAGVIETTPVVGYEIEGERFYEFKMSVDRLSEQKDVLPVTISERIVISRKLTLEKGKMLGVLGEFRSYNKIEDDKSKLMLHFFVQDVLPESDTVDLCHSEKSNNIKLTGYVCKTPTYRVTPFGRQICDILIAVNRTNVKKSDYIPCIAWGRNALYMKEAAVGSKFEIVGRMQSRNYQKTLPDKTVEERVAYEVSCQSISMQGEALREEQKQPDLESQLG